MCIRKQRRYYESDFNFKPNSLSAFSCQRDFTSSSDSVCTVYRSINADLVRTSFTRLIFLGGGGGRRGKYISLDLDDVFSKAFKIDIKCLNRRTRHRKVWKPRSSLMHVHAKYAMTSHEWILRVNSKSMKLINTQYSSHTVPRCNTSDIFDQELGRII